MKSELLQFGDWTVLYMLAVNMEPMVWGELVLELQQILKVLAVPPPHFTNYLTFTQRHYIRRLCTVFFGLEALFNKSFQGPSIFCPLSLPTTRLLLYSNQTSFQFFSLFCLGSGKKNCYVKMSSSTFSPRVLLYNVFGLCSLKE
jgi:hypothetical protein